MAIRVVSLEDQKRKNNSSSSGSGLRNGEYISSSSGNRVTTASRNDYDPDSSYYYVTGANGDVIRNGAPAKIGGAIIYINDDGKYRTRDDYSDDGNDYGGGGSYYGGGSWGGGYNVPDFSAARRAAEDAINARTQQIINGYEGQKSGVNQSALDAARQAYISKEQSLNAAPQQMAAMGNSGGLAESSLLGINSNYENNRNAIVLNRDNALNDIDTGINNAKLEGAAAIANSNSQFELEQAKAEYEARMAEEQRRYQEEQAQRQAALEAQLQEQDRSWQKEMADYQNQLAIKKAEEQAKINNAYRSTSSRASGGGSGGSGKPLLTYSQAMDQYDRGNDSDAVLDALQYHTGKKYGVIINPKTQKTLDNLLNMLGNNQDEFNRTVQYGISSGQIDPNDYDKWARNLYR